MCFEYLCKAGIGKLSVELPRAGFVTAFIILGMLAGTSVADDNIIGTWEGTLDSDNYPNGGTLSNCIIRADGTTECDWTMDIGGGIIVSSHAVGTYTYVAGVFTATYEGTATESGYGTTNGYTLTETNGVITSCDNATGDYDIVFDPKTGWPSSDSGTWNTIRISEPTQPTTPSPNDGSTNQSVTADLNWSNDGGACTFDVYFGTDFDDVNNADNPYIAPGMGNQPGLTYEPGLLEYNRTYYWRIDSDNTNGTTRGDVWRFRTEIPELSDDGYVWMEDLAILVSYWLDETCAEPNWCEGTDFNRNGATEFDDFAILGQFWCVDTSLVGHWEMDDNASNTFVSDSSGYGNDGTAQQNTSVLHTAGVIDGALTFNGTSDYIDCGTDVSLALTRWSMSAWIYRSSDSAVHERLISKSNTSGYDYWLQIQPDAVLQAGFVDGGGTPRKVATTETVSLDTWYHVAATWDGSYVKIYIDGQPKATSDDYSSYAPRMSERPFNIGRLGAGGSWYYGYNGAIDDVMMFDRALTGEEVEQLYQQGQD